jgi:hypothetical protein
MLGISFLSICVGFEVDEALDEVATKRRNWRMLKTKTFKNIGLSNCTALPKFCLLALGCTGSEICKSNVGD